MLCKCKTCGKEFKSYAALTTHSKWKHGSPIKRECSICSVTFRDSFGLKRHVSSVHSKSHVEQTATSCPLCDYTAPKKLMRDHFSNVHDINLQEENLTFYSQSDFMKWKKEVELETCSKFVKHRASKTKKDGTVTSFFYCYRDGQFRSQGKGLRALKKVNKLNAYCPAFMKVEKTCDHVTVLFRKTHVGHSISFNNNDKSDNEEDQDDVVSSVDVCVSAETDSNVVEKTIQNFAFDLPTSVNDEINTINSDEIHQIPPNNDVGKTIAIVINVPSSSSEEILMKKKQEELEKLVDILNSIKTHEGLHAFQQHVASLKSIVEEAENRWSNVISIHVLKDNTVEEIGETIPCEIVQNICGLRSDETNILEKPSNNVEEHFNSEIMSNDCGQLILTDETCS